MLVCLDIGNTSASYGIHTGKVWKHIGYVPSFDIPRFIPKLLKSEKANPHIEFIVSSTVPQITHKIGNLVAKNKPFKRRLRLWVVGGNLKPKIKHNYRHINKLGKDRLVNAYGAARIYGAPLLILDYGTALTCDYLSEKGVFAGGLIIPGPEIAFKALCDRATLLPKISFPKGSFPLLGRDTRAGMKAGILQGYGAMTDGLVERFRRRYGRKFRVVATGGLAKAIYPYTSRVDVLDPLLTLKSLVRIFKDRAKKQAP